MTGGGGPRMGSTHIKGDSVIWRTPPFIGNWNEMKTGGGALRMGKKNNKNAGMGYYSEKNSPFNGVSMLGAIL